ncbi:bifunctional helix-turn-helix transcriptional regulator/GNAT family N-acetyltransferase [Cesiribacter andamanensis]|uniref:Putative acetyltransferase n=1 Tax=Cesiribacter andamanensis AMV16 TaxID=1279009 RepID=M7NVH7_9BACT|nr:bifunctional helix-turn-helix transcriptional regulator/GNAT family N-acetyltransferase [Cesiribacter andamanensis]EMR02479.1 putative acetyltransferase [Cesiribacter andamanensis AMV16]
MTAFEQLGSLALASRLKLLSERLAKDVAGVYQSLNIPFEPRWFTLFWTLSRQEPLTITELARELRQTHAAIVQITNLLEKKGLLQSKKDKNDERRRQVSLSPKGKRLFESVEPVLGAIQQANDELLRMAAPDFLASLQVLEQALDQRSMQQRIQDQLQLADQGVAIRGYDSSYRQAFRELNRACLQEQAGALEPADEQLLHHPEEEILNKGGMLFFALYQQQVVGTAALLAVQEGEFQLDYLTVDKAFRRRGIGKMLLQQVLTFAGSRGRNA